MKWGFFLVGLLVLVIGLNPYLTEWGLPHSVTDIFSKVPTFGLHQWIIIGAGIILLWYGLRRTGF